MLPLPGININRRDNDELIHKQSSANVTHDRFSSSPSFFVVVVAAVVAACWKEGGGGAGLVTRCARA